MGFQFPTVKSLKFPDVNCICQGQRAKGNSLENTKKHKICDIGFGRMNWEKEVSVPAKQKGLYKLAAQLLKLSFKSAA